MDMSHCIEIFTKNWYSPSLWAEIPYRNFNRSIHKQEDKLLFKRKWHFQVSSSLMDLLFIVWWTHSYEIIIVIRKAFVRGYRSQLNRSLRFLLIWYEVYFFLCITMQNTGTSWNYVFESGKCCRASASYIVHKWCTVHTLLVFFFACTTFMI